jgi:putative tricarboxylic transport membrane protein
MKRLNADTALALVVALIALAYLWADSKLPATSLGDPLGPRLFPALVGCGLLLSAVLLVLELISKRKQAAPAQKDNDTLDDDGAPHVPARVLLGTAGWLALYYVAMEPVGYLISTPVFLAGLLAYFNRGRWLMNAIVTVAFTLVVDALFTYALGVPLAEGILHI